MKKTFSAKIVQLKDVDNVYKTFLTIKENGITLPYIHIPENFDGISLNNIVDKLNEKTLATMEIS